MTMPELLGYTAPVAVAMVVVLMLARGAGRVADRLAQPRVVGEIVLGALSAIILGSRLRPLENMVATLHLIGAVGLALFLVGAVHGMRVRFRGDTGAAPARTTASVAIAAFAIPMLAGVAVGGIVLLSHDPRLRGGAPVPAFLLFMGVALAITAVPVLARILADHHLGRTVDGRVALASATLIDAASWPLLACAVSIAAGSSGGVRTVGALGAIITAGIGVRHALRTRTARHLASLHPRAVTATIAVAALVTASLTESFGLTEILGSVVVGALIPVDIPDRVWSRSARAVGAIGKVIVPLFFVTTGLTLVSGPGAGPWPPALLPIAMGALVLGFATKIGGGYIGARLGGRPRSSALTVGVLLNTRGLTEIVVLQAGYAAGILTAPLFLALILVSLILTATTVPLIAVLERMSGNRAQYLATRLRRWDTDARVDLPGVASRATTR